MPKTSSKVKIFGEAGYHHHHCTHLEQPSISCFVFVNITAAQLQELPTDACNPHRSSALLNRKQDGRTTGCTLTRVLESPIHNFDALVQHWQQTPYSADADGNRNPL